MICKNAVLKLRTTAYSVRNVGNGWKNSRKNRCLKEKRIIIISAAAAVLIIAGIVFGVLYTNYVKEQEKKFFGGRSL